MRILFLTHRLPYAPNRGDRVRAYHILKYLSSRADVDLLSLVHDDDEASHVDEVKSFTSSVTAVRVPRFRNAVRSALRVFSDVPTTHTMLDAPDLVGAMRAIVSARPPDLVFAFCTGVAHVAYREPIAALPLILDTVDVDSAKWADLAAMSRPPRSWIYSREVRLLSAFEKKIARRAAATLITTDHERDALLRIAPDARVIVMQNGVDAAALRPPDAPNDSATVVFCGVMNYPPNEEGAIWLAREVWPLVLRRAPQAQLQIVGSHPTPSVQRLASSETHVEVTGHVADVRQYLWRAAVAAAPLHTARGVQNKVLEAVTAGLPTVVTPVVWKGLPDEVRNACVQSVDGAAFADAIVRLLARTADERRKISARVDLASLMWDARLQGLEELIRGAIPATSPRPGSKPSVSR